MNHSHYWELLLAPHHFPCLLAQVQGEEVVYYNEEMAVLLEDNPQILGKKFYDIIPNDSSVLGNNPNLNWENKDMYNSRIFNKALNQVFAVTYALSEHKGDRYIFCQYRPVQTTKHFHYTFEEMMSRCISLAQEPDSTPDLLEILGAYYNAEKVVLYQIDHHDQSVSILEHWSADKNIPIQPNITDKIDVNSVLSWFNSRNEIGMLEASRCHGNFCPISTEAAILEALDLEDVVISVIDDSNQQPLAVLCIADRKNKNADFRLLQAVTRFVETGISKSTMHSTLSQLEQIDMLTGFHSRNTYAQKMEEIQNDPCKTIGVVFANVNGLKKVNTDFGLAVGDSYIKKAAKLIHDHFNIDFYRISGDEFVGFFYDVEKEFLEQQVIALQGQIQQEESTSFAMGHAWSSGRYILHDLVKEADNIMYINKQEYYHSAYQNFTELDDSILGNLLSYLKNDEFLIHLQPQFHLKDATLYGAEALIRRFDKTAQKMVFPDQFIPLYEQKSVIRHVDIFVVEKVCQLLQSWLALGKGIPISVNLSRVTLQEYGIVNTIAKICDTYQVPRKLVVIEVTERVGLVENNVASSLIQDFKDLGFHISLDDFGCAYSNIVTLSQIEVDEVKIDKSLIDFLTTNQKNRILVKNVLAMCHELEGTSTLAEGIETQEQSQILADYHCHLGQGYYYSRPIPVDEFARKYILPS